MTAHVPRLPFALDPLIREAKRRARQRRVLVALGVVLVGGLVAGFALALRPSGGGSSGGLSTANYPRSGVSLRYPSGLNVVPWCEELSSAQKGYLVAVAVITSERVVGGNCKKGPDPLAFPWPPVAMRLGRDGIIVAVSRVKAWPVGFRPKWNGRVAAVPTNYPPNLPLETIHTRFGCSVGVRDEARSVAIRRRGGSEVLSFDALICGPDFAAGRGTVRQMVANTRFTR